MRINEHKIVCDKITKNANQINKTVILFGPIKTFYQIVVELFKG